jgi:hypothetical protein
MHVQWQLTTAARQLDKLQAQVSAAVVACAAGVS